MADKEEEKKDEVPAFRISPKKVDDSWKEEARREREAAAKAAASPSPKGAARAAADPAAKPAAAHDHGHEHGAHDHGHEHGAHDHGHEHGPDDHGHSHGEEEEEGGEARPKGTPVEQAHTRLFMSFLAGLAQQALMQMGEIENPFSGQREMDLQGARGTIELLTVIQNKTKGNLTEDEDAALRDAVRDLKMRYVEITQEMQRQMAQQAAKVAGAMKPGPGGTIGKRKG